MYPQIWIAQLLAGKKSDLFSVMLRTCLNASGERLTPCINATVTPMGVFTVPHIFSGFCCLIVDVGKGGLDPSVFDGRLEYKIKISAVTAQLTLMEGVKNIFSVKFVWM